MNIMADLHIHSKYAQATSKDITIENLEKWAKVKGLNLLGTGDFQHPLWFKELNELKEDENGILWTKNNFPFIWQTEISLIYTQDSKGRRIHHIVLSPNKEVAKQIIDALSKKGRLDYDGRPIFGFTSIELVDMMISISSEIEIIPAHAWTPWFSIFGSMSGFNSVEECFKERTKYIHAIETGMSSDPAMNWRLSKLDNFTLISNSDSHSHWPWRLGRECNVFDINELSYKNIINAIRTRQGLKETIEVDPNYGKYHYDGHRLCKFSCSPEETKKLNNICPVCKKKLTIGVLNRVDELADREENFKLKNAVPFRSVIPLQEILSTVLQSTLTSKKTWQEYDKLINAFKDEFNVLLSVPLNELKKITTDNIAAAIIKNREGKIKIKPGFDGQYGEAIFEAEKKQSTLF